MRLFNYVAMFVVVFAMACEKDGVKNDNQNPLGGSDEINIEKVVCDTVDDMLMECDEAIDGKEVHTALAENGVVLVQTFELREGKWCDNRAPGGFGVAGYVVRDGVCNIYGQTPPTGEDDMGEFVCWTYDCRYDEVDAAIFTKSKFHDFEYSAKVIYIKDNTIILDGVLGSDDYMNEDYAERRVLYLCKLDAKAPESWSERLK